MGLVQNELAEADHGADRAEDGLVDVGSSFGADTQAAKVLSQASRGALHRPADFAQVGAVLDAAVSDDRRDATGVDQAVVLVVVVAAVGVELA